jgi:hypothetical protein
MLQIKFFNRLNAETREHHIDDTYIVVGPINSFQWTYSHLRLVVDGGEVDLSRFGKEAIIFDDMLFGDFRIEAYDPNNKDIKSLK